MNYLAHTVGHQVQAELSDHEEFGNTYLGHRLSNFCANSSRSAGSNLINLTPTRRAVIFLFGHCRCPEWLRRGVDASLTALGIDHIDLYQVHWPDTTVPAAETAGALRDLITEGKIGHVGVSNYAAAQMREFTETLPVETLQPPYHLFRREIEDEILPYCLEHDIGVLVYGPLATGC